MTVERRHEIARLEAFSDTEIIALPYRRAWSRREQLALTPRETLDARLYVGTLMLSAAVAPVQMVCGMWVGRRRRQLGVDAAALRGQ